MNNSFTVPKSLKQDLRRLFMWARISNKIWLVARNVFVQLNYLLAIIQLRLLFINCYSVKKHKRFSFHLSFIWKFGNDMNGKAHRRLTSNCLWSVIENELGKTLKCWNQSFFGAVSANVWMISLKMTFLW